MRDNVALSPASMARFASIGFEFTSPMIAGALIGHYFLDPYFRTDPWLTLVMFLAGLFAGFYRLVTELSRFQRESRN